MLIFKVKGRGWWYKLWVRKLNQVADAREGTGYIKMILLKHKGCHA